MHPTTAQYLAKARQQDLAIEAAKAALAAEAAAARRHGPAEHGTTRWGLRLPHLPRLVRRGPVASAATA